MIRYKKAEKSQNADSGKEKKIIIEIKKKTMQQQKRLPTLSADLTYQKVNFSPKPF